MTTKSPKRSQDGYIYHSYGKLKYLKSVIASVTSLKKFDKNHPVALVCDQNHRELIKKHQLESLFDKVVPLNSSHCSITGFKHNTHEYLIFDKNLFLDSDIIWCKSPHKLWKTFSPYSYTTTGNLTADAFFGSHKDLKILSDLIFNRRKKTLNKFGLTYLSRVQAGMMFCQDHDTAKQVNELAKKYLSQIDNTHFRSRKNEKGRSEESCEWSLAMAMAKLGLMVTPWHWGTESPQIVYVSDFVEHDKDFNHVKCTYYTDLFMENLKGLKKLWLVKLLRSIIGLLPGKKDYITFTPYSLHFGFYHEKEPFYKYVNKVWHEITNSKSVDYESIDVV